MPYIEPSPQSGVAPAPPREERSAGVAASAPVASRMPVPADAGREHVAALGDYITLGVGVAGVGALAAAAFGGEGVALGAGVLAKNAVTAAKAFGPKIAQDWKAGAAGLKDAAGVGTFAAEQTTAAVADWARSAVIGTGLSAGAALAQRGMHALAPQTETKPAPQCNPRP
jgi:hypothetical protein